MKIVAIGLVFALSGCAHSRLGHVLDGGVIGSGIADLYTTRAAIDQGRGKEGNPLLGQSLWQQALIKALGTSVVIYAASVVEDKGTPVWAHLIRGITIAVWSYASLSNHRIGR